MIVVDSNVLAARNLSGDRTPLARQVEERDALWIVPPLWRYEFQNILTKSLRARQIALEDAWVAWQKAAAQMSDNEHEPSPERVIELSERHRITAYDANFVVLAMEMGVQCVTEDGELREKFPAIALSMEEFVAQDRRAGEVREARAQYKTRSREGRSGRKSREDSGYARKSD